MYLTVVSILSFVSGLLPAATSAITEAASASSGLIGELAVDYILQVSLIVPSFATPFVALILLKPLRTALKSFRKIIMCRAD